MLQDWPANAVVVYGLDQWDLLFIQHCMVTMLYEKEVTMLYAEKLLWSRRHTNHCIRMPVFWDLKHRAVCRTENPRNVPLWSVICQAYISTCCRASICRIGHGCYKSIEVQAQVLTDDRHSESPQVPACTTHFCMHDSLSDCLPVCCSHQRQRYLWQVCHTQRPECFQGIIWSKQFRLWR